MCPVAKAKLRDTLRRVRDDELPEISMDTVRASHAVWSRIVRGYFRSTVRGMENIPDRQCLFVAHHDGGVFPVNGVCFGVAWYDHFKFERGLYVLTHDLIHTLFRPFTELLPRSGLVPADRQWMDRVVESGHDLLVFPGAARETFRTYWEREQIDLGGRTGFIKQAMKHNLPIVPVVSAGSHETLIVLRRGARLARWLGLRKVVRSADNLPLLLGLPWGIWILPILPQFPLPATVTTQVLAPVFVAGDPEDELAVKAAFDQVLGAMQKALAALYAERRYPIVG